MICCLTLTSIILIAAGVGAVVLWRMFSEDMKHLGPLIILGPILLLTGILVLVFMLEICVRLKKQIKRVMDPSLLKTSNFHEVKHWIEPGKCVTVYYCQTYFINLFRAHIIWMGSV